MFFRNLTLFRFSPAVATDLDRLDDALAEHRLRPCGPLEMFTRGFVPPVGRGSNSLDGTWLGSQLRSAMVAMVHPLSISICGSTVSTRGPSWFSPYPRTDCEPPA